MIVFPVLLIAFHVPFVAIGVFLIVLSLIRMPGVRCGCCGYDLRGNRSGRCPECGDHGPPRRITRRSMRSQVLAGIAVIAVPLLLDAALAILIVYVL